MVTNLKDLERLLRLCRKQGVLEIDLGTVKLKLGDLPIEVDKNSKNIAEEVGDPYASFPQGELTPEQLAFYSSGGLPENDPENQS